MFCMKCGTEVPDDANFCPKCGFAFGNVQMQENNYQPAVRQLKIIRKQALLQGTALLMEVNLLDERGSCVAANSLSNGNSCFMDCYCDARYRLNVNTVGGIGRKESELIIDPGDNNMTILLYFDKYGKIAFERS